MGRLHVGLFFLFCMSHRALFRLALVVLTDVSASVFVRSPYRPTGVLCFFLAF
jgi:hypothetical protein